MKDRNYRKTMELSFFLAVALVAAAFRFIRLPEVVSHPTRTDKEEPVILMPLTKYQEMRRIPKTARPTHPIASYPERLFDGQLETVTDTADLTAALPHVDVPPDTHFSKPAEFLQLPEVYPVLLGGDAFIRQHLVYPEIARLAKMEGLAIVKVYLDEKGNVVRTELVSETGHIGFGEAALHVLNMTRFSPAYQRDQPVRVAVNIPIRFRLK